MTSDDYKRGYSRGYNTASRSWPEHKPPCPPEPVVRQLMEALRLLRDTADAETAAFDEDDPIYRAFGVPIATADEALSAVTEWLRESPTASDRQRTNES